MHSAPLSNSNSINSQSALPKSTDQSNLSDLLKNLKADMQELADDLMGGQQRAGRREQPTASENKENIQKQQLEQLRQDNQQLTQKGKAELEGDAQQGASLQAGDEEFKLKKKKEDKEKALRTKKKLAQLFGIANSLEDVEFEDKEHQQVVDQFLKNMNQIRGMAKRLEQLDDLEEKYEEQIERQEAQEKSASSASKKRPREETSKVGPLKVQNISLEDLQKRQDKLK